MDNAAIIARVVLAGIFAVSGTAKMADRPGTRRAVEAFGLPKGLIDPIAAGLPIAECMVAVALIPGTTAWVAAFAAIGLLAAFIAGISVNLLQGRRPDCNCFGNLHSSPVGGATIARNVMFMVVAVIVVGAGSHAGGGIPDAFADLHTAGRAVAVVAAACAVLGLVLLRRRAARFVVGRDARPAALPGLEVGTVAPAFTLPTVSGDPRSLDDLLARGNHVLLMFVSMNCGPCLELAPELARWQREFPDRVTIAIVSAGSRDEVQTKAETYGFAELLIDEDNSVSQAYRNEATPGALLIDPDGAVASERAAGQYRISDLLLRAFGLTDVVASLLERNGDGSAEADTEHAGHEHADDDHADHQNGGEPQPDAPPEEDLIDPETIDGPFVPRARANTAVEERAEETVVVDLSNGLVHLLNPTAAIVWLCLDGTGTIAEIAADIAEAFGQEQAEVFEPVLEVVRAFGRQGLLEGVGTRPAAEPVSAEV